ncbi:flagellar hook-associated protein FlgK [Neobacillus thermocopriae]|uniref:flagellar hook-associated protein FlgK n=1 Tax=Neobacillus thermocopriae TaxID=1215031 RepID=UPI00376F9B7F
MVSTFHGIEVGRRALSAQQSALTTTGHNIANANTTGYSRQRAEMQATSALSVPGMHNHQIGTGVDVTKLVRLREEYLDVQLRGENKNLGYWEAKSDTLSKIEEMMNEPSDTGLAYIMDEFWKGWQELAKNPESAAARAVIRQKGVAVAETFHFLSDSLTQLQNDLKNIIMYKTNEVNSLANQIANLNAQISRLVINNYEPNDLYDQRDLLLDQLSKIVNINTVPDKNGMVTVSIGDSVLVSGDQPSQLTIGFDETGTKIDPNEIKLNGKKVTLESGELLGRIESLGTTDGGIIPNIKNQIDTMAKQLIEAVNRLHEEGLNLKNISGESTEKYSFFTGDSAGNISVNNAILESLDLIAAAREEVPGSGMSSSGNGENAKKIADIKFDNSLEFNGTTSTLDDFYRNIIAQLGIDSQEASRMKENSEVIIHQVENRRQSVSGVSLDEEMANMIKFQQAYNAAARMVTVMDQCLDKVINGMGRVGL